MPLPEFAADNVSVVVKGAFNPAIFSPAWFLAQGLIGQTEVAASEVEIISREVAVFSSGWLRCQVTKDTFQVSTDDPAEFERVRDVAIGVLRTLEHTPIALMGINRAVTFVVDSSVKWHAIGDTLAPKKIWQDVLFLPGLTILGVQGARRDSYDGRLVVQVAPTKGLDNGVTVAFNDHFTLSISESQPTSRDESFGQADDQAEMTAAKIPVAIKILSNEWTASMRRAEAVIERVARQPEKKK